MTGPEPPIDPVRQLLDVEAIKQLKARYFRLMDTKQWEAWGDVLATDVRMEVPGFGVRLEGRSAVVARVSATLRGATSVHHGHMAEVEILGPDTARAIWAMSDHVEYPPDDGRAGFRGSGHYHEEYVREGGRWRIASFRLERLRLDPA